MSGGYEFRAIGVVLPKGLVEGKKTWPVIIELGIIKDNEGLDVRILSQFLDGWMDELSPFCVKDEELALGVNKAMTERFDG